MDARSRTPATVGMATPRASRRAYGVDARRARDGNGATPGRQPERRGAGRIHDRFHARNLSEEQKRFAVKPQLSAR